MSECESLLAECRDNLAVAVRRATEAEARISALEAENNVLALCCGSASTERLRALLAKEER